MKRKSSVEAESAASVSHGFSESHRYVFPPLNMQRHRHHHPVRPSVYLIFPRIEMCRQSGQGGFFPFRFTAVAVVSIQNCPIKVTQKMYLIFQDTWPNNKPSWTRQSTIIGKRLREKSPRAEGSYDARLGFPFVIIVLVTVYKTN